MAFSYIFELSSWYNFKIFVDLGFKESTYYMGALVDLILKLPKESSL